MKHRTVSLVLVLSLLMYAAAGFSGCGNKHNHLSAIIVAPPSPFVVKGTAFQLSISAIFSDGLIVTSWSQVSWQTSDPTVATVGGAGLVTAVSAGTAVITATDLFHPTIACSITVSVTETPLVSIEVAPPNRTISLGTTAQVQFTAARTLADGTTLPSTGKYVTWSSSRTDVATISNSIGSEGLATAVASGTTWITATDPLTNISGLTTLTVTP